MIFFTVSCDGKKHSKNLVDNPNIKEFYFPDSTYVNTQTQGYLKYNLKLDSLDVNDIDERFTLFYIVKNKEVKSLGEIKKTEHKIFIDTTGRGLFNFKIEFERLGYNIISGVIEDNIIFKTPTNDGKIRIISKEVLISKDIFVDINLKSEVRTPTGI